MKGKDSQGIGRLKFGEGRPLVLKIIYPISIPKIWIDKQSTNFYFFKLAPTIFNE